MMYSQGMSQKIIAETIGRDKSVISRELSRNRDQRSKIYKPDLAQRKCSERHRLKPKKIKLDGTIKRFIDEQLAQKLSPEQIVGLANFTGVPCVSHERIYQYIWAEKKAGGTQIAIYAQEVKSIEKEAKRRIKEAK